MNKTDQYSAQNRTFVKSALMQNSENRVPIWIVLILLFVHVESRQCFNNEQNESICSVSKGLSSMDPAFLNIVLKGLAKSFGNLFENIDSTILDVITSSMKHCPIEDNDEVSIAMAFKFHIYHPQKLAPEVFDGLHFMKRCQSKSRRSEKVDYTIFLWHGWMNNIENSPINCEWSANSAQELANTAKAQVIDIDWGTNGLSSCNYLELVFCYIESITKWMANRIFDGSKHGFIAPIEKVWMVGHSLGARFCTFTAENIYRKTKKQMYNLILMDIAGILFANDKMSGRCQVSYVDHVQNSTIIYTNPNAFGTNDFDFEFAKVKIFSNAERDFCQVGCKDCDPICCHSYGPKKIFYELVRKTPMYVRFLRGSNQPLRNVTIFEPMESGFYDLTPEYNPGVL